jgi:ubiquinone/menaquinone biosynthesis C-methylase UbiE
MKKSLVKNPLFARYFNRFAARMEERGNRELRQELLSGLSGRVIEVGAGNGLNFAQYPRAVREVVAVEPEPYLRDRAAKAAAAAAVPIRVTDGTAEDLPAADGEFDAVVVSGLLCSVPDTPAALAEFRRPRPSPPSLRGSSAWPAKAETPSRRVSSDRLTAR